MFCFTAQRYISECYKKPKILIIWVVSLKTMPKIGYIKLYSICFLLWCCHGVAIAQRSYVNQSVLASGNWYKIAVAKEGIYKIDLSFLNNCGINTQNLSSAQIKIYGNTPTMLPEANDQFFTDDLQEIPLQMNDGGDGVFLSLIHI